MKNFEEQRRSKLEEKRKMSVENDLSLSRKIFLNKSRSPVNRKNLYFNEEEREE
jgi:hypothetical protein